MRIHQITRAVVLFFGLVVIPPLAQAVPLIDGIPGATTYGDLAMLPNDDGSSSELNLPFALNFFGNTYNSFFINNNGNVSFNGPIGTFTPNPFPISNQPMIAPYWSDVDTRCATCGNVYIGSPNSETVVATWNNVGFYFQNNTLTNNFQLVLRDQGSGDFDIEFRFDELNWTTGDASGGTSGLGGTPAQSGFDAGDGQNFFTLPGSRTADVLELQNQTNVSGGEDGLWSFAIRGGGTPGETPDNPLLPVIVDDSFLFDFNIDLNEIIFIDPDVAVGYDYAVQSGPNFASVLLPTGFGDDLFDLYLGGLLIDVLQGGVEYMFGPGGVSEFTILGIEPALGVDPTDPTAFVTGVSFTAAGQVVMTQTPITEFVGDVPAPSTWALLAIGMLLLLRRRNLI